MSIIVTRLFEESLTLIKVNSILRLFVHVAGFTLAGLIGVPANPFDFIDILIGL